MLKIRSGVSVDSSGKKAGKGPLIQTNVSATLGTFQDQFCFQPKKKKDKKEMICYNISPYDSNAMKSKNPHSGIQKVDTTRTLDLNGGNPCCNQGGVMVLAVVEGNGSRPSHKGLGISEEQTMYTLNSTEVHGVVYGHIKSV